MFIDKQNQGPNFLSKALSWEIGGTHFHHQETLSKESVKTDGAGVPSVSHSLTRWFSISWAITVGQTVTGAGDTEHPLPAYTLAEKDN